MPTYEELLKQYDYEAAFTDDNETLEVQSIRERWLGDTLEKYKGVAGVELIRYGRRPSDDLYKHRMLAAIRKHTGRTYNRVEVIEFAGQDVRRESVYLCRCLCCGRKFMASGGRFSKDSIYSCGCTRKPMELTDKQKAELDNVLAEINGESIEGENSGN